MWRQAHRTATGSLGCRCHCCDHHCAGRTTRGGGDGGGEQHGRQLSQNRTMPGDEGGDGGGEPAGEGEVTVRHWSHGPDSAGRRVAYRLPALSSLGGDGMKVRVGKWTVLS